MDGYNPSPAEYLRYLIARVPSPTKSITHSAQNGNHSQIQKAIYKLIDFGIVKSDIEGGQGKTAVYTLNE